MRFITGPRCIGKTTALIKESARTDIPKPTSIDDLEICLRQLGINPFADTMWD